MATRLGERKLSYPERLEEEILEWVLGQHDCGLPVSIATLKDKVRVMILPYNEGFRASDGAVQGFKTRNGLSLRSRTSMAQRLSGELEKNKDEQFPCFYQRCQGKGGV